MDIVDAIKQSNLGKYQKAIDTCNKKNGCDSVCTKSQQKECPKLKAHSKEMSKVARMTEKE
jgi:hypothetical protein